MRLVALHTVVPVRSEASETSEQLTQLLFAETCQLIEQQDRWLLIRNDADGQTGWCDRKMLTPLSEEEESQYLSYDFSALVSVPMAYAVSEANHQTFPLTASTRLPNYKEGRFNLLGSRFLIDPSMVAQQPLILDKDTFLNTTRFFLNIPYLWGGKNALGLDCSGFTQVVMSLFGVLLPRNASQQVHNGDEICFLSEARLGDLAFFSHGQQTDISHVGILLDTETILHCSGRVKVEKIDNNGIISSETGEYTHWLRAIKRVSNG